MFLVEAFVDLLSRVRGKGVGRGVQTAYREGFRKSTREVAGERQAIGRKTLDDHWPSQACSIYYRFGFGDGE